MIKTRLILPLIVIVMAFLTLMSLGIWQVQRLEWKKTLLADLARARQTSSSTVLKSADFENAASTHALFIGGTLKGTLLTGKAFLIGPRVYDGVSGYHLYVPLRLKDGGIALVNLGWVKDKTADSLRAIQQDVILSGVARHPDSPNAFTPANNPAQNLWYSVDLAALRKDPGLGKIESYVFYADAALPDARPAPVPAARDWQPPNNHLQYAAFWFSMAGLLLVLSAVRLRGSLFQR